MKLKVDAHWSKAMGCQFRFVEEQEPQAVTLRLFVDGDGEPQGDVTGPLLGPAERVQLNRVDRCLADKDTAFWVAIRIANANDAEIVVTGDAGSWDARWGELICERYSTSNEHIDATA